MIKNAYDTQDYKNDFEEILLARMDRIREEAKHIGLGYYTVPMADTIWILKLQERIKEYVEMAELYKKIFEEK